MTRATQLPQGAPTIMKGQRLNIWTSVLPLVFLGFATNSTAQVLFESHDILDVTIEAPLKTFARVRSDVDYLDGTFSYTDEVGETRTFDLKLRARGRFRRAKKTCNFPPIRLNFKKGQVKDSIFGGEDKLKLVTHCQNKRAKNEQFVLREYMAYRIFQILTDKSFGARLLRITYVNNEKNGDAMTKYGFVIEVDDHIGERLGMEALETEELNYQDIDGAQTNMVNLFQYMIGNTDYSLIRGPVDDDCCHNSVPFSNGTSNYPIPYDFDFSGLVDAPYAEPNPMLKLRNVRTRLYRGRCGNGGHLGNSIAKFLAKKDEIYDLRDEIGYFDQASRKSITRYLDDFYEIISDPKSIDRRLIKGCS
jgi:hypothetical protein